MRFWIIDFSFAYSYIFVFVNGNGLAISRALVFTFQLNDMIILVTYSVPFDNPFFIAVFTDC